VAGAAGGQLDSRHAFGSDTLGVAFCFNVPLDNPDFNLGADSVDGMLEQCRFTGSGAGDEVEHNQILFVKVFPIGACHRIVGREQGAVDIDDQRFIVLVRMVMTVVMSMGV